MEMIMHFVSYMYEDEVTFSLTMTKTFCIPFKTCSYLLQGLEIVNPQAAETRINEANAKYFSNTSGFLSVGKNIT